MSAVLFFVNACKYMQWNWYGMLECWRRCIFGKSCSIIWVWVLGWIYTKMEYWQICIHMLIDSHSLIVMNVNTNHVPFERFKRTSVCSGIQWGLNDCVIGDKNEVLLFCREDDAG